MGLELTYTEAHFFRYLVEERLKYLRGSIVTTEMEMKEDHPSLTKTELMASLNTDKYEKDRREKLERKIKDYIRSFPPEHVA